MAATLKISEKDKNKLKNLTNAPSTFVPIPAGDYDVILTSMKCKEMKADEKHPEEYYRLIIGFEIQHGLPDVMHKDYSEEYGDYSGQTLYYLQNLNEFWMLRKANKFIQSLKSHVDLDPERFIIDGDFDMKAYNELLDEILEDLTTRNVGYQISRKPQVRNPNYTEDFVVNVFDE